MSKLNYPDRILSLSDCHGGRAIWNPLEVPDVAARLAEAIRSDLRGVFHFCTFGAPEGFNRYIVKEALRLHRENPDSGSTGLFINSAPRTEENNNGESFSRSDFQEQLVVVATPLSVVSGVRDSIIKLSILPNEDNGLYKKEEQHRSSYALRLLAKNHGLSLEEVDTSLIPEKPDGKWLSYVDRFGNLVLSGQGPDIERLRERVSGNIGGTIKLRIGSVVRDVTIGESLPGAEAGSLVIYENDGNLEVLAKWDKTWTIQERLDRSAYKQFGSPEIGVSFEVVG